MSAGYEQVRTEFEHNFTHRSELGAAFAAVREGRTVVDLWGGIADARTGRPWRVDTLQLIFSGTKGLIAVCLLMLLERGKLNLETPVARYWPEFAAAGKSDVLVRDFVSHQARLPGAQSRLALGDVVDSVRVASLLAAQPQETDPRAELCYHPLTYGWLCGELVRRVDGRSVGRFFAEEIAEPLGLDLWIGLPEGLEFRVSTLALADTWGASGLIEPNDLSHDRLKTCIYANPPLFRPEDFPWNQLGWHRAEIPGANAIGTARSIARLYGCLAQGGSVDGVQLLRQETIEHGRELLVCGDDGVKGEFLAFGIGFELQTGLHHLGPPPDAFGHGGAGGSVHGAWPEERVGFSYSMNLMRDDTDPDPRGKALLNALHAAIGSSAQRA